MVQIKAEEFLNVTKLVASKSTPQTEPFFRSAISRAYYAAHLSARELYLTGRKISPNANGIVTHRMMIRALKGSELPGLGHQLDQLLDQRITADYNLRTALAESDVLAAIAVADRIITELPNSARKLRSAPKAP